MNDNADNGTYDDNCNNVLYTIADSNGLVTDGNSIDVLQKDATMTLVLNNENQGELYLSIENLNWDYEYSYEDNTTDTEIRVKTPVVESVIEHHTNDYQFYNGRDDYSVFLGDTPVKEIQIEFAVEGTYSFENLYITDVSREKYGVYTEQLSKECLENVKFATDSVKGTINVSADKYLVLSIPYAKGWKAYVDGKETEVLLANGCYTGLLLSPGNHTVELKYSNSIIKASALISGVSFISYLLFVNIIKKRIK